MSRFWPAGHIAGPRLYAGLKFSTSFLAVRRETYDSVRRLVPLLRLTSADNSLYQRILEGDCVAVYHHG